MTTPTSLVNLALQSFGSRTTITDAQLLAGSNNEAKQANLTFTNTRDSLFRLAPWDCAMKTANLVYITSVPGTPENTSPAANLWAPGIPRPPWAYEYQYPSDCLRTCWLIPSTQTGFTGVPITTAVTGSAPYTWLGGPIVFKVGVDVFYPVTGVAIAFAGFAYVVGEILTMPGTPAGAAPIGAPVKIIVTQVDGDGQILACSVLSQVIDADPPQGGSYFAPQANPVTQASTTGVGNQATFDLTFTGQNYQRVILTNQEYATMVYVAQVVDPNIWDPLFQDAFQNALGGDLCLALTGDKGLAKICYGKANQSIIEARTANANEGLTINDVTPDWIRGRGIGWADGVQPGPYSSFNWGGLYGGYNA